MTLADLYRHFLTSNEIVDDVVQRMRFHEGIDDNFEAHLPERVPAEHYPCDWVTKLAHPIAEQIKEAGNFQRVELIGPMGLASRVSFHCYTSEDESIGDCRMMTVQPDLFCSTSGSPLRLVDYSKHTEQYAAGTMGDLNGLNYSSTHIDPTTTGEGWLKYLS